MTATTSDDLKYPVGRFTWPAKPLTQEEIKSAIQIIRELPEKLGREITGLDNSQVLLRYRPEGWTISQVVHHCADSHMNAFVRFKLTLTEDIPTVKPYKESLWATLPDASETTPESSLKILEGMHKRWAVLLENMSEKEFARTFFHPEHKKEFRLDALLSLYAWHSEHHLGHVKQALRLQFTD